MEEHKIQGMGPCDGKLLEYFLWIIACTSGLLGSVEHMGVQTAKGFQSFESPEHLGILIYFLCLGN
jgi:hypothetical protein